jgi:hypothetical protein
MLPCLLTPLHHFALHMIFRHSHQALRTRGAASNIAIIDIGHATCLVPCIVHIIHLNTQLTIINTNHPLPDQSLHEVSLRLFNIHTESDRRSLSSGYLSRCQSLQMNTPNAACTPASQNLQTSTSTVVVGGSYRSPRFLGSHIYLYHILL